MIKEKLEEIFSINKKINVSPKNYAQLAEELGVSRQSLWTALDEKNNKGQNTLAKVKIWIEKKSNVKFKKIVKVKENKLDHLLKLGFQKQDNKEVYFTDLIKCENFCYGLHVGEDRILNIYFTNDSIFANLDSKNGLVSVDNVLDVLRLNNYVSNFLYVIVELAKKNAVEIEEVKIKNS